MKQFFLLLTALSILSSSNAQDAKNFTFSLSPSDGLSAPGFGWLTLVGSNVEVSIVTFLFLGDASASLVGPTNTSSPFAFVIPGPSGCALPSPSGGRGSCFWQSTVGLTEPQIQDLLAGLFSVEFAHSSGIYRGQVMFLGSCSFQPNNAVQFVSELDGDNPLRHPRFIRWGRSQYGLTGTNLSYELFLPEAYRIYTAEILSSGHLRYDLAILNCTPLVDTNPPPDAAGLEFLPRCVVRGAICIPESVSEKGI